MVRLSLAAFSLLTTLALAASDVLDLIPSNFDDIVFKSGKPALVEFFAPWCGHCKSLAPIYEELATSLAHASSKVSIAKVNADEHKSLGKEYGVQGFPTLKWFSGKKGDAPEDYNGGRDIESLTAFVTEKTGIKSKGKKAEPSSVEMLTDATFSQLVGKDQDVLVAFTAPWCGHCKSLAPTWEKVASDFSSEPSVLVAKVDAESPASKSTAESQGVSSYPTIKYFPKGSSTAEEYNGGRSEEDFVSFINEKAGTHRIAGGGLSALAGTIGSLDELVERYISEPSEKAGEEIKKAAAGLKDTSAAYYVKVLEKMGQKPEYAKTEQSRLQKILSKGGLTKEKIDDLTKRSNVLGRFFPVEKKSEL